MCKFLDLIFHSRSKFLSKHYQKKFVMKRVEYEPCLFRDDEGFCTMFKQESKPLYHPDIPYKKSLGKYIFRCKVPLCIRGKEHTIDIAKNIIAHYDQKENK